MSCEHYENEFNFESEEDIIVNVGGAARAILMDMSNLLIDLCQELGAEEIKIQVRQNYDTGDTVFKAKVNSRKVLEVKANDFVPY